MAFYTNVTKYGNKILHIGYDNEGNRFENYEFFEPMLATECSKNETNTEFTTIEGRPIYFKNYSIKEARDYVKNYKDIFNIYNDIPPEYQFINMMYPNEVNYEFNRIRKWFYDIEVYSERGFPKPEDPVGEIVSIAVWDTIDEKFLIFTTKDFDTSNIDEDIEHLQEANEARLIMRFINYVKAVRPDMLIGWFSSKFDDPYIINRAKRILPKKEWVDDLSVIGKVFIKERQFYDNIEHSIKIPGLSLIDYVDVYKKYTKNEEESYSLDFIAAKHLGDEKIGYSEYENINEFYKQDPQKYFEYNIQDVRLIRDLDNKLKYLELMTTITYMAKCNFNDTLGSVKVWDVFIYNYLYQQKKVVPINRMSEKQSYSGAYVHPPTPGLYKYIAIMDLTSLYPHLIMQYNISPECLSNKTPENVSTEAIDSKLLNQQIEWNEDLILSGNGYYFEKETGFIPEITEYVFNLRKAKKKIMLDYKQELSKMSKDDKGYNDVKNKAEQFETTQEALKILINSLYGCYANEYFRYFDIKLATAITISGQWAIKHIIEWINNTLGKKLNYTPVIYGDTDSIMINFEPLVEKFINKHPNATEDETIDFLERYIKEKISPLIDKGYKQLAKYCNAKENRLEMKLEKLAVSGIFTAAKKRYAMDIRYDEGIRLPGNIEDMYIKGIEIVRSSTPNCIKPFLKEALFLLMRDPDKLKRKLVEWEKEFHNFEPKDIAFPRGVTDIKKYEQKVGFKSGTPIHVRAGIVYNRYIKNHNINLPFIENGSKLKFLYMKKPNPTGSNVMAFYRDLPDSSLKKYVDYNKMWEKSFLKIIEDICNNIGMQEITSRSLSLNELF